MNDIVKQNVNLPDTIEDLTQFVLVGKAKLNAYMVKLQAVNRLSVAQEIRDQTLKETQEISTALIAAEQRIGELLLAIPKASGARTDLQTSSPYREEVKTKSETIKEMGYGKNEAADYQQMAKNPEVVQQVIDQAIANGKVMTKAMVMKEIKHYKNKLKEQEMERSKDERSMAKEYESLQEKYLEQGKILQGMKEQRNSSNVKLTEDAESFVISTYQYIKKNGGLVWVSEKMKELPKDKAKEFKSAIYALDAFSKQMIENAGGYEIE